MLPRLHPIAVLISSSCGPKDPLDQHEPITSIRVIRRRVTRSYGRPPTMAKTMAKLQARARKTSRKKAVGAKPKARPKQTFNVSHFRAEDFRADGLRSYAKYRDLGMTKATNGLLQAHVIRLVPPCDPAVVSKRHFHDVDVQMIYVLKGWIK